MTPDEVIQELQRMNVNITRRTLLRYETAKLIPAATRGGQGRGKGRTTDYPKDTPAEAYVANALLHGNPSYKPEVIARARQFVLKDIDSGEPNLMLKEPACIYWLIYFMLYNEKIDLQNHEIWIDFRTIDTTFNDGFEKEPPEIPPDINLENYQKGIISVCFVNYGIVAKMWDPQKKKWSSHVIFKNAD
ncbi:hypothetical protein M7775_05975 [Sporomusa sphaeroides DSM 2875]|uniref:hypothetical protein n=1 Tax=Sporomusa sphaeroides TaxID=47679 RepID=UPI00202DCD32|nr:hypothetical protein [Sporomusa sphaeroides]MCM0758123.1 hypothetical protein [Sporomusa sphaeroides DSM 2875]